VNRGVSMIFTSSDGGGRGFSRDSAWKSSLTFLLLIAVAIPCFAQQVVINEIMYHPNQPYSAIYTNRTEYIEIYNTNSTASVDLSNYRFDNGVTFQFPSGATLAPTSFAVVCENMAAFTNGYANVNVLGVYQGTLKDSGTRLTLSRKENDTWVTNASIQYINLGASDGEGRSLELVNPAFARFKDFYWGAWAVSTNIGGTPGRVNGMYDPNPPPVIGEVKHDPPIPFADSVVTITARAAARDTNGLQSVALLYRVDAIPQNVWSNAVMSDDGGSGDAVAGDGTYTIRWPPYGAPGYTNGTILEFKVLATATNSLTFTVPCTNTVGNTNAVPNTFLCYFGEDTGFTGEYTTYHILMTRTNRSVLETYGKGLKDPWDCTFITSDGEVFYNSGVRYRGDYSLQLSVPPVTSYRIVLPAGRRLNGKTQLDICYNNSLLVHLCMTINNTVGKGAMAPKTSLRRMWMNEVLMNVPDSTSGREFDGVFDEQQTADQTVKDNFADTSGNSYLANGSQSYGPSYAGDLSWSNDPSLAYYQTPGDGYTSHSYLATTNNPATIWIEMTNLCWTLSQPPGVLENVITNRVKVRSWAREFAAAVFIDTYEGGYWDPSAPAGDELRIYADPADGCFQLIPWDYSKTGFNGGARVWGWSGGAGYAGQVIRNFLFNRPMSQYYVGDVMDIVENVMTDEEANKIFDSMGSALSSSRRSAWLNTFHSQVALFRQYINTNIVVSVGGTSAPDEEAVVVSSSPVTISGMAPQTYTATFRINGSVVPWSAYSTASMQTQYGTWTTNVTLSAGNNQFLMEALDTAGDLLKSRIVNVAYWPGAASNLSGTVSADATWGGTGSVVNVINDVTVNSGAKLSIAAGTVLIVTNGKKFDVQNGTLALLGTAASPICGYLASGASSWSLTASGAGSSITGNYVIARGGRLATSNSATLSLFDSAIYDTTGTNVVISASGGGLVTLRRCVVSDFARTLFDSTPALIEECLFQNMTDAGIEFRGPTSQATVSRTTVRDSCGAGSVDAIRYATNSNVGLVTNCYVHDVNGNAVEIGTGASGIQVCHSLMHDCACGIAVLGTAGSCFNNTIAACTNALIGAPASTYNMLIWGNVNSVSNGPAVMSNSDVEVVNSASSYAGTANINKDPFFRDPGEDDYTVLASPPSPCLGGGGMGISYIGALPTVTSRVGAKPIAPTALTATNSANLILLTWQDNSSDEKWFEVERSGGGNNWTTITNLAADTTNATDGTAEQNKLYYYRVRAAHERGSSFYTDEKTAMTAFSTNSQDLVMYLKITEMMYNPNDSGAQTHEFIELKNVGGVTLNLGGCYFSDGVVYTFPTNTTLAPGLFFIIAKDPVAFSNWYPSATVKGVYSGSLANGGERVRIKDSNATTIYSVTYNNAWYATTDGQGCSLVVADINGDPDLASTWRPSTNLKGSPGADDPAPTYGNIVINELIAHSDLPYDDAIEVYNAGASGVDIAGWYLSDDSSNMKKYQITNAVLNIPAGNYHVFYGTNSFHSIAAGANGFNLGELGGDLYLSSATSSVLTSFRTSVKFDETDNATNGVSLGRYVTSDSNVDFTVLSPPTFGVSHPPASLANFLTGVGASNAYPKVGPVVISEIMYNPSAAGKEYVEIHNITNSSVALFDTGHPSNTWRLAGGIAYTFPTNTTLAINEYALVVSVDPAEFRALYGITNVSLKIFGPFDGALANNNDTVNLYKPGQPQPITGFVPQYKVDHVHYYDSAPWPTLADNGGASLERKDCTKYGNDPANWVAASVGGTPGVSNNATGQPSLGFARPADHGVETNGFVDVELTLFPPTNSQVTVNYTVTGTATAGSDYVLPNGNITFWPYETNKTLRLQIKSDVLIEPDETVVITLSGLSGNARYGGNQVYTYTIIDQSTLTGIPTPTLSPPGTNFIYEPAQVTISCANTNAQIYYTTDGSIPTTRDTLYTGAIIISNSARVTAKAFLGSYNSSLPGGALYMMQNGKIGISNPKNGLGVIAPYSTVITATVYSVTGTLQKVEFFTNSVSIGSVTSGSPYPHFLKSLGPINSQGTYVINAAMTDGSGSNWSQNVTVNVYTSAPSVEAGTTGRLVNVVDDIPLDGSATLNGWNPSQVTVTWSKNSGPGSVTFSDASSAISSARFSQGGAYILYLTISYGGTSKYDWVAVNVVSSNTLSTIPFYESFEEYGNGIRIAGINGWVASDRESAVVRTNSYAYTGTLPIPGTQHTLALDVEGSVTNAFISTNTSLFTNTWVDAMIECRHWTDADMPSMRSNTQFGVFISTNRHMYVWNCQTSGPPTNVWTQLPDTSIGSNEWVRLTVQADYTRVGGYFNFRLWTNGTAITNPKMWFTTASTNRNYLSEVAAQGMFHMDDLVVEKQDVLTWKTILASIMGTGHGSISPSGSVTVAVNSTTNFFIAASNWCYIADVLVDGSSVGAVSVYGFTNITVNHTIQANIGAQLAASNTPKWWLWQYYADSNQFDNAAINDLDGDGRKGWQEYIAGTVPTNPDSVLEVFRAARLGTSNVLYWIGSEGRLYSIYKSTNITKAWPTQAYTSNIPFNASGTNVWGDTNDPERAGYYRLGVRIAQ
jgi:hypothetical protein